VQNINGSLEIVERYFYPQASIAGILGRAVAVDRIDG